MSEENHNNENEPKNEEVNEIVTEKEPVKPSEPFATTSEEQLKVSCVMGEVLWLMSQSILHRHNFFMGDADWLIIPPVIKGQFKLFRSEGRPAAFASWAFVNEDTEKLLEVGFGKLPLKEWDNGNRIWLIDVVAPYGKVDEIIADIKKTALKGKSFKYHKTNTDGTREVIHVQPNLG